MIYLKHTSLKGAQMEIVYGLIAIVVTFGVLLVIKFLAPPISKAVELDELGQTRQGVDD